MTSPEVEGMREIRESTELRDLIFKHLPPNINSVRHRVEVHYRIVTGQETADLIFAHDRLEDGGEPVISIESIEHIRGASYDLLAPADFARKKNMSIRPCFG